MSSDVRVQVPPPALNAPHRRKRIDKELMNEFGSKLLTFEHIAQIHAAKLYEALRDPSVHQFINSKDFLTQRSVFDFIARVTQGPERDSGDRWLNVACFLGDEVIGLVQATVHGDWAEIAFLFDPTFQGKGYATEAVSWMIDHLRDTPNIREFWATTVPRNERAIALLIRTGFLESKILERALLSYDPGDLIYKRLS